MFGGDSPMRLYQIYILFTLGLSLFGPVVYRDYSKLSVLLFMTAFLVILSVGFRIGLRVRVERPINSGVRPSRPNQASFIYRLIRGSIRVSFLLSVTEFAYLFATNRTVFSLANIGENYLSFKSALYSTDAYTVFQLLRFFSGFPRLVATVLGMYEFPNLSRRYKVCLICFLILDVAIYAVAYGTQKPVGDILIYFLIVRYVKMFGSSNKKKITTVLSVILCATVFVLFAGMVQLQRYSSIGITAANIDARSDGTFYYDLDHWIFRVFGEEYGFGLASFLSGYLSGGYYGLSLCLRLPFVWTYGFGSSYPMSVFLNRFLGLPFFYEDTYLNRMEIAMGRPGLRAWNTIFPWLASDLTFPGALAVFLPVGILYAICWKETILNKNPVSFLMFAMLTLGLIFVPANNQLFNSVDGYIATVLAFLLWSTTHKASNYLQVGYARRETAALKGVRSHV